MAKGDPLTSRQQSIVKGYYEHHETMLTHKLSEAVSDLYLAIGDPRKSDKLWEAVARTLTKTPADPARVNRVLATRDLGELAKLAGELSHAKAASSPATPATTGAAPASSTSAAPPSPPAAVGAPPAGAPPAAAAPADPAAPPTPETLKSALKAFRKRLKVTSLDEASKLGRSPLSSGRTGVVAISPPTQFPRRVWDELVAQGKLRAAGGELYQLVEP